MRNNYRFISRDETPLYQWRHLFGAAGLDLESELNKLVVNVIGQEFKAVYGSQNGYLGVTSDNYYRLEKGALQQQLMLPTAHTQPIPPHKQTLESIQPVIECESEEITFKMKWKKKTKRKKS